MTPEHLDDQHDESPAPPATTRWDGDTAEEDAELLPPYIPGWPGGGAPQEGTGAPAGASAADATDAAEAVEPGVPGEASADADEAADPGEAVGAPEPFPFDMPYDVTPPAEPADRGEPAFPGAEPDEFPFDAFEIEGDEVTGGAAEPGTGVADEQAGGAAGGWDEPWAAEWEEAAVEAQPPDAGTAASEPTAPEPIEPPAEAPVPEPIGVAGPAASGAGVGGIIAELADRLEALAEALRRDGEGALDREGREGDRLGSVLAGLLSGYLAGRGQS